MRVQFVDLEAQHRPIAQQLQEAFCRVLNQSSFILGPEVARFEKEFASFLGVSDCIAVNTGTAALQLVLQALGVGPGDEVITVPNTFIATAEAITAVGARPVFVDVDPVSYTMDPIQVEDVITSRSRAILPVHLYGQPADMDLLLDIGRRFNLPVVEDACQAHGAQYKGKQAGSIGKAGCFSFYPSKNLGCCGEGGAVVTADAQLAERVRLLRNHGSTSKYEHAVPGYNFRMEGMQGAFLATKLKYLDAWNAERRAIAALYTGLLSDVGLVLPAEMPYARHVYHLYVIQANDRDRLRQGLAERGIETGLHYPTPLHLQRAYQGLGYRIGDFPVSELASQRILSLPIYPGLNEDKVESVASTLLELAACRATETLIAS